MANKLLPWLAAVFILLWSLVFSWEKQSSFMLGLASIVAGILIVSVLVYSLYRLTGHHSSFISIAMAVSIGLGIVLLTLPIRNFLIIHLSVYSQTQQFFLLMELLLFVLQLVIGALAIVVILALLPNQAHDITFFKTKGRLFALLFAALLLFEVAATCSGAQSTNVTLQSNLTGAVHGERLFANDEVLGRCNVGWCVASQECYVTSNKYHCPFVVDILLNRSVQQHYQSLRNEALRSGNDTASVSILSNGAEISRITINFTDTLSDVNYFSRSTTITFPYQRQLQALRTDLSHLHWA
jgi:hypothetical protein